MSRPGQELSGTLSYRTEPRKSPRLSLFHLKLTDSALRCLRDFQKGHSSGASLPQPVITFQGNQGNIKIPCPISGSDDRVRVFAFYLSREIKDKPQSSFECIRQSTTWTGEKQLSCIGTIQDKITVCATDESYQLTRDRVSQVEKETWSRTAIEIKPGTSHRGKYDKIGSKSSLECSTEDSPSGHRPPVFLTPAAKKCNRVSGEQRSLQEWLIHLLALKPYRKHDLILRLEKSNTFPRDQMQLLCALDEVGCLNPKDGKYSLREELYSQVHKEWMGYTPEERKHLLAILSRKNPNISSSQNHHTDWERTQHNVSSSNPNCHIRPPETKRPASTETEKENCKRIRSSSLDGQRHERHSSSSSSADINCRRHSGSESAKKHCHVSNNHSVYSMHEHKKSSSHRTLQRSHHKESHRKSKACDGSETNKMKLGEATSPVLQVDNGSNWHKHQKRNQESGEEEEDDWEEEAILLERCLTSPEEKEQFSEASLTSDEAADYLNKYSTITSEDQRALYEEDFSSDYTEYLELHSRIGKVLDRFMQLGSKMKKLQQGTVEHKMVENKIVTEYKKFKKTYPGYREEKTRCEYLHDKLSHIKHLILEYEKNKRT